MKLRKRIERDIVIKPSANNGFIVEVGCVKLSYSDHYQMCRELAEYLSNPKKYEKAYRPLPQSASRGYGGSITSALGQVYSPYH